MSTEKVLDVTQLPPREKHPTVFQYFDALTSGDTLVIENDHDPKPLYYELLAERGDIFTWEYLEKGPEWYKVKMALKSTDSQADNKEADLKKAQLLKDKAVQFKCSE